MGNQGHEVVLIDPKLDEATDSIELNGSSASLGVLMGYTFQRSKGRAWQLRKRSMELWPKWIKELKTKDDLILKTPLIKLASSLKEAQIMQKISEERKDLGVNVLKVEEKIFKDPYWPSNKFGGLISNKDGRIDPHRLLNSLKKAMDALNITYKKEKVISLERSNQVNKWKLKFQNDAMIVDHVVICAALASQHLIEPLGHKYSQEPVIGQALKLKLSKGIHDWSNWPAVLVIHGTNLIPDNTNEIIIGATLEPGEKPLPIFLKDMQSLKGDAPDWLKDSTIIKQWHGIRSKPVNRPAPILEKLEPGLILATGHYRNGILLAPATAEWVSQEIKKS